MARRAKIPITDPTKAIAYVRVSTDRERQELGDARQRSDIEAWAEKNKVEILFWCSDEMSGGHGVDKRTGLAEAIALLTETRAGILVFQKWDRFGRMGAIDSAIAEREVERTGAKLVSADGIGNGDDPTSILQKEMIQSFARFEKAIIRGRIKAALAIKKARGEMTGAPPFGFRSVPGPRTRIDGSSVPILEKDENEQKIIHMILDLRDGGLSLRDIVDELERIGLYGRKESPLSLKTVFKIVRGKHNAMSK